METSAFQPPSLDLELLHQLQCENGHAWYTGDAAHHDAALFVTQESCPTCHAKIFRLVCPEGCPGDGL